MRRRGIGPALKDPSPTHLAPADPAPAERPEESRALTGLRAIAALLVMLHHFYLHLALDQHIPMLQWLLRKGYLGVDLFFVLSGFVMSLVYATWFDGSRRTGLTDYLRFMLRRVARLWPVHATMLVIILLVVAATGQDPAGNAPTPRLVMANFAMIQAWGTGAELNIPAWSVSTEFMAYLLFPLLTALSVRGRWGAALCAGLVVAALAACMAYAPPLGPARRGWLDLYFNYSPLPVLRCLAGFTLGILAWRAGGLPRIRRLAQWPGTGPLALLLFVVAMLGRVNDLVILPLLPVIVLGMHHGRGPVQRALGREPLHGLGVLSYASYLVHYLLLGAFPFHWAPLHTLLPLYLFAALGSAVVLYHGVERPGRYAVRWLGDRVLAGLVARPGARPPLQDRLP